MIHFSDNIDLLNRLLAERNEVFAICDKNVKHIAERLGRCANDKKIPVKYIQTSEKKKGMDTVLDICGWLLDKGADRGALVLAIGGGITTDMVGFAASIYKRGVKAAYVPTTLLAQVDAAVGGKTGVNFKGYKNMIGTIVEPEFTFICSDFLKSLPEHVFREGVSELLKTYLIDNSEQRYEKALAYFSALNSTTQYQDSANLLPHIKHAVLIKEGIVQEDLYEKNKRRVLNLGHTFAHGIEHLAAHPGLFRKKMDISHGEAVAMGIILAARLSFNLGLTQEHLDETLREQFLQCGLKVDCPFHFKKVLQAAKTDKKAEGDIIHFVLLRGIGDVVIKDLSISEAISALS
ncbi:MAG: 3-dehydroquinate synthase [Bacteroidales bacterium]|nr:3-dehydroquinate synthase [Bacteroidales bacterium]